MFTSSAYNTGQNPNINIGSNILLISNFCHVLNVVCFLLGNSLVSELDNSTNNPTG